jgi:diguanylate cyclase (GGDEF)-like protein
MFGRSFRSRLTSFFIGIVILPMVAVSVILFRLVADSERGKSDARLGTAQTTAQTYFSQETERAARAGRQIGQSPELAAAIAAGDAARVQSELGRLMTQVRAARAVLALNSGKQYRLGEDPAVGHATTMLVDAQGRPAGKLKVALHTAQAFAGQVHDLTGLDVVIVGPGGTTEASTLPGVDGAKITERGDAEVAGRRYRVTSFTAPAFEGGPARITMRLLSDERDTQTHITSDSLVVAALLSAFLIFAFAFALMVSRSLQAQIQRLLEAARRLGGGEFSVKVPTEGNDEFAALGSEFNAMASQLQGRLEELEAERTRLQHAIRRVGESFAKGLDRDALLRIVVQTAVDGVAAETGRARVREVPGGPMAERAHVGQPNGFEAVLQAAETAVLDGGDPAEAAVGGTYALAHPLHPSDGGTRILGLISLARNSRSFSDGEKDLFNYLASQAAVSIENVDLHETVQRQAVTDELTGLFNHRRFQEVMSVEVERAKRFDQSLGLIMLDIDDFKSVNDHYGHLQGDQVLREVAHVLLDSSREIDEPARYGGEEMAIALPQTDLEGAAQFAERVRQRIEDLEIPLVHGNGSIKITASFGAAAMPHSAATDKDALVAAADSALYRAKRLGKNRVVKAG